MVIEKPSAVIPETLGTCCTVVPSSSSIWTCMGDGGGWKSGCVVSSMSSKRTANSQIYKSKECSGENDEVPDRLSEHNS